MTQGQVAVWTKREFKLIAAPDRYTISDILKNAAKIKNEVYGDKRRRKSLKVTSAALDSGLKAWVARVESKKDNISGMALTEKARQLQKETGKEHGLNYENNSKAWLTSQVFQKWLHELDVQMRGEHRHILLLLDNASPQKSTDMTLINVIMKMLPSHTTPCLQPMDTEKVAAFKACYQTMWTQQAIAQVDGDESVEEAKAYKIDQLTAMSWSEEIWGKASAKTIAHCWRHTQLVLSIDDNEYSSNGEPNIAIMDLAATFTQMSTLDLSMH